MKFCEKVISQFKKCISERNYNIEEFSFFPYDGYIKVYQNNEYLFYIELRKFSKNCISEECKNWEAYKGKLLDEFFPYTNHNNLDKKSCNKDDLYLIGQVNLKFPYFLRGGPERI